MKKDRSAVVEVLRQHGPLTTRSYKEITGESNPFRALREAAPHVAATTKGRGCGVMLFFLVGVHTAEDIARVRAQIVPRRQPNTQRRQQRKAELLAAYAERLVRPCFAGEELHRRWASVSGRKTDGPKTRQATYNALERLREAGLLGEIECARLPQGTASTTLYYHAQNPDSERIAREWAAQAEVRQRAFHAGADLDGLGVPSGSLGLVEGRPFARGCEVSRGCDAELCRDAELCGAPCP